MFDRSQYLNTPGSPGSSAASKPISVCYGGCCIDVLFPASNGCVEMVYRTVPGAVAKGHLLGHFADNFDLKVGPRAGMLKTLFACPDPEDGNPTPFSVIEVRYRKGMAISSELRSGSSPGFSVQPAP